MMRISEDIKAFILANREQSPTSLALMAKKYPDWDIPWVAEQVAGWQTAKGKLPSWAAQEDIIYPPRLSMEQCSSEPTAAFKASLFQGNAMADLTGGWGVDAYFFGKKFESVHYLEQQERLTSIASHNFQALNSPHIQVHHGDSLSLLHELPPLDFIYLDPARRDQQQRKVVGFEDCAPDVLATKEQLLAKAPEVLIKASPMIDIKLAISQLQTVHKVWVVAVNNECKEILFLLHRNPTEDPIIEAVNLQKNGERQVYTSSYNREEASEMQLSVPLKFLYEPHAALMKAGLFRSIPLAKLHPHSHLYTSDALVEGFPGRIFEVEEVFPFQKKRLKKSLPAKANLATRNFPLSVADIRKQTGLKEGGDIYLFATTMFDSEKVILVCTKMI